MQKMKSVKGWVVLEKSEEFDWYPGKVLACDAWQYPNDTKASAQKYIKGLHAKHPGVFQTKLKPCVITF